MSVLVWDEVDEKLYQFGVDQGVLYDENHTNGVAWNGLVSVESSRKGSDPESLYYDSVKRLDMVSGSDYELKVSAFTIPIEFSPCMGYGQALRGFLLTKQPRRSFGMVYRSQISTGAYQLHLIYNATVISVKDKHSTIASNVEASAFSFVVSTRPERLGGYRPTAHVVVQSDKVPSANLKALEDILFGSSSIALIDGGPVPPWTRIPLSGGGPSALYPVLIDGGTPYSNGYATPTLISPEEVFAILEGS